ncbi:MAG: RagB/SusD family nutrient uptake outer membrane protein, partial [Bacteroidales bacterium]|nr:RagB/SusD family nutrient uptake outer membrane protein [Bacteroidales bacterium]
MKKIILFTTALLLMASCSKMMDTQPTTESSLSMLETTDGMQVALDGIYASMYNRIDYLTANTHQTFGNMSIFLAADLMGEDMVQTAKGPGWFWNDYT